MLNLQGNSINRSLGLKENPAKMALFKHISDLQNSITELQIAQIPLCSIQIGAANVSNQLNIVSLQESKFYAIFIYDVKDRHEIEQSLEKIVMFDNGIFLDDEVVFSVWANKLELNKNLNIDYKINEFKVSPDNLYLTFKSIHDLFGDNCIFEGTLIDNEFYIKWLVENKGLLIKAIIHVTDNIDKHHRGIMSLIA